MVSAEGNRWPRGQFWVLEEPYGCDVGQWSPTFLAPGTGFLEDNFFHGRGGSGDGSGSNAKRERWGEADEASLTRPPLTSCCAAWFLTVHGLVPAVGDP